MTLDPAGRRRHARDVVHRAAALVLVVLTGTCLFAGHGHLPQVDDGDHPALHPHLDARGWSTCTLCVIAQQSSFALSAPQTPQQDDRSSVLRRMPSFPRADELLGDEQSPRGPPRSDIG